MDKLQTYVDYSSIDVEGQPSTPFLDSHTGTTTRVYVKLTLGRFGLLSYRFLCIQGESSRAFSAPYFQHMCSLSVTVAITHPCVILWDGTGRDPEGVPVLPEKSTTSDHHLRTSHSLSVCEVLQVSHSYVGERFSFAIVLWKQKGFFHLIDIFIGVGRRPERVFLHLCPGRYFLLPKRSVGSPDVDPVSNVDPVETEALTVQEYSVQE